MGPVSRDVKLKKVGSGEIESRNKRGVNIKSERAG